MLHAGVVVVVARASDKRRERRTIFRTRELVPLELLFRSERRARAERALARDPIADEGGAASGYGDGVVARRRVGCLRRAPARSPLAGVDRRKFA